jgi:hypothetical protein
VKLRYTGLRTVTFITAGVGEVEPGAVFSVPDENLNSFVNRTDIEVLPEDDGAPEEKRSAKKKAVVDTAPDPLPETVEPAPAADTEIS